MPVDAINAPGGKVVVVENNYGRVIVGDSYPKLILRAAITGLVAGLVLLFGKYAIAGAAAWFAYVGYWLFRRQPVREVVSAGGSTTARLLLGGAAIAAMSVAPRAVQFARSAGVPGPGPEPTLVDGGVVDAVTDAPLDAPPPDTATLDLGAARVVVGARTVPGGCARIITSAQLPTGASPAACGGARTLAADLDDLVVVVDLGPQALDRTALAALAPTVALSQGDQVVTEARATELRIVGGHPLYTLIARAPATTGTLTVRATVDGHVLVADATVAVVEDRAPFRAAILECRVSARGGPCELPRVDHATLYLRLRRGEQGRVRVTQTLDRELYTGATVGPLVDERMTIAPVPARGSNWVLVIDVGRAQLRLTARLPR